MRSRYTADEIQQAKDRIMAHVCAVADAQGADVRILWSGLHEALSLEYALYKEALDILAADSLVLVRAQDKISIGSSGLHWCRQMRATD